MKRLIVAGLVLAACVAPFTAHAQDFAGIDCSNNPLLCSQLRQMERQSNPLLQYWYGRAGWSYVPSTWEAMQNRGQYQQYQQYPQYQQQLVAAPDWSDPRWQEYARQWQWYYQNEYNCGWQGCPIPAPIPPQ